MTRSNLLWGLGGAIVGAIATYFVMERIYEKELAEIYGEPEEFNIEDVRTPLDVKHVVEIVDAEKYKVDFDGADGPDFTVEGYSPGDPELDKFLHVVSQEEHMEEDEEIVMQAIYAEENEEELEGVELQSIHFQEVDEDDLTESDAEDEMVEDEEDPEQEDDDMNNVVSYDGISIIEVSEVSPGRRIIARFNHDTCNLEVSSVMSVKTEMFDDIIDEQYLEELLGVEGENILMNAEPSSTERMLAVRNNIINLDFAISY